MKISCAWEYKKDPKKMKIINYIEKTDEYNKPREILKGLQNCIWKTRFFLKMRFFNLSVDKTQSMVALRTSVFVSESNKVQPIKRVCIK